MVSSTYLHCGTSFLAVLSLLWFWFMKLSGNPRFFPIWRVKSYGGPVTVGLCRPVSLVQPGSPASKAWQKLLRKESIKRKSASEKIKDLDLQWSFFIQYVLAKKKSLCKDILDLGYTKSYAFSGCLLSFHLKGQWKAPAQCFLNFN